MTGWIDQRVVPDEVDAARTERFPVGAALEFADMQDAGREYRLDELRAAEPVSWVPAMGGWLVTGRDAAKTMLLPRSGGSVQANENLVRASTGTHMLTVDDPEHTRMREPFEVPFRAREAEARFRAFITHEADSLINAMRARGKSADILTDFAAPFAVHIAAEVIGLPLGAHERIDGIYTAFAEGMVYDGDPQRQINADAAREQLNAILMAELVRRRDNPDDSLTSHVISHAGTLSDEEVVAQLRVVMFGAIETIQASVSNTLMFLLQSPDQLRDAMADTDLLLGAVDESLRLMPPVAFIERWMKDDLEIEGVSVPAGEFVGISVIAANRDPRTFSDPLRFDIRRENSRHHLSFSGGEHHCLGVHLARMQTAIALDLLLTRLPALRMIDVEPPAGFAFRKPGRLVVAWD
jgi:cytochrome P450